MPALRKAQTENKAHTRSEPKQQQTPDANKALCPSAARLTQLAIQTVTGYVVEVTPALAKQWLEENTENRNVRRSHLETLAREIRADRWRVTHQGIAFSALGRLMDGQHRLHAIIRANKSAVLTVFVGLDDNMFGALDRGQRRTVADELLTRPRYVHPCVWIAANLQQAGPSAAPPPADVRVVLTVFLPELEAMLTAAPSVTRLRGAAAVMAALMVRLKLADAEQRKLLLEQWEAIVRQRFDAMDKTSGALVRRLDVITERAAGKHARNLGNERAAAAWLGSDPNNREIARIRMADVDEVLAEICAAARRVIAANAGVVDP